MQNNFLFLEIGPGLPLPIVKKIIKKFEVKNAYATVHNKDIDDSLFTEPPIYLWDAFWGNYPAIDQIEPIDRVYENPISEYSVEILHQMSRHGNWNLEKRISLYYTHLKFWDNFLETKKINYVIFSAVPHETYNYIIYLLCKEKKIQTCMSYVDGYKELLTSKAHYMLNSLEEHTLEVREKFDKLKKEYEGKKAQKIILPNYIEQIVKGIKDRFEDADNSSMPLMNQMRIEDIKHYFSDPQEVFNKIKDGQESFRSLFGSYRQYLRGIYRTKKLIKKYEEIAVQPDFSAKYFFYAMHYQPECTSSPLGGLYANQLLAIQLIAHNLPDEYWLYVKEHPAQSTFGREPSYYSELIKIPKVKVVSQKVTSEKLMKHAIAMATLTGTVIYESQVIQKPCLCLGHTPLEVLDGVYKINTNEDCRRAIDEIVSGNAKITTIIAFRLFLKAMDEICFSKEDEDEYYNKLLKYIKI